MKFLFDAVDANGNGKISFDEAQAMHDDLGPKDGWSIVWLPFIDPTDPTDPTDEMHDSSFMDIQMMCWGPCRSYRLGLECRVRQLEKRRLSTLASAQ